jgi:hypothetical protein
MTVPALPAAVTSSGRVVVRLRDAEGTFLSREQLAVMAALGADLPVIDVFVDGEHAGYVQRASRMSSDWFAHRRDFYGSYGTRIYASVQYAVGSVLDEVA